MSNLKIIQEASKYTDIYEYRGNNVDFIKIDEQKRDSPLISQLKDNLHRFGWNPGTAYCQCFVNFCYYKQDVNENVRKEMDKLLTASPLVTLNNFLKKRSELVLQTLTDVQNRLVPGSMYIGPGTGASGKHGAIVLNYDKGNNYIEVIGANTSGSKNSISLYNSIQQQYKTQGKEFYEAATSPISGIFSKVIKINLDIHKFILPMTDVIEKYDGGTLKNTGSDGDDWVESAVKRIRGLKKFADETEEERIVNHTNDIATHLLLNKKEYSLLKKNLPWVFDTKYLSNEMGVGKQNESRVTIPDFFSTKFEI